MKTTEEITKARTILHRALPHIVRAVGPTDVLIFAAGLSALDWVADSEPEKTDDDQKNFADLLSRVEVALDIEKGN